MADSTRKRRRQQPKKPSPKFPLFPHPSGRWFKKIRGKHRYFGPVAGDEDGQKALARWLREKDYLLAGQEPPPEGATDALTIEELVNHFLHVKRQAVEAGELSPRT